MIKRIERIIISVIIMILFLTIKSNAFTIQMSTDKNEIKTGDEVIYTLNLDENVVAANFDINYNSSSLELIGSSTNGLDVASKNGKIACIYADIDGRGTDSFQVRFRARTTGTVTFSISDAKFRGVNQEISYTNENITGLNTQTNISIVSNTNNSNSNDNTISQTRLPNTGVNSIFIIIIIAIAVIIAVVFKIKLKKVKNILPVLIGIVMLGTLTYNVQAATNSFTINFTQVNGNI